MYIININKTGISIRNTDKNYLVSYSLHNFNVPKNSQYVYMGDAMIRYQQQRWTRFLNLSLKLMKNVKVIKNDKLIFSKGVSK